MRLNQRWEISQVELHGQLDKRFNTVNGYAYNQSHPNLETLVV